jgi:tetratricopeptide (TPR) repeat protein
MNSANRIFISYSHRGNGPEWKAKLLRALHVFEQHYLLDVWQDGKIRVSSYWDDDIQRAMNEARCAVVLLTPDALDSRSEADPNYILNTEFPCLSARQQNERLPVFPVVCEECNWRAHEWLRATQAPNNSQPLSQLSAEAQDRVLRQLATDIASEISRLALVEPAQNSADFAASDGTKTYLDKFPLTRGPALREEKLIGREQELTLLDLAFAQPSTAIASLVAWGGVGKTMLVQHWLRRLQREGWFGVRRVYAWSFYSQGTKEDRQASEDMFLAHALEWFGVKCEPTLSPWDKGRMLADAVACERTLLIIDGIEPLQYPPGPMGGQLRKVGEDESHLRAPGVQSLLKQLARKANTSEHHGLCLVTTRVWLADLSEFQRREGSPWGSALRIDLGNLTDEAGAALLYNVGVDHVGAAKIPAEKVADTDELLNASREVGGHALTLNLLGRFLAHAHSSDIRRRDLVKFEEADRTKQGGTTFKMLAAFENWFNRGSEIYKHQLAVLRILGLFDRPADAGCLGALRKPPVIAGLTDPLFTTTLEANTGQATVQPLLEEDWNTATSFLADFGLIAVQVDANNREGLLDCHPLIREHFAKQLREKNPGASCSAHRRLYENLRDTTEDEPDTLEGLQPLYQAVAHGCHANLHQEACDDVYYTRINRQSGFHLNKLGAFGPSLSAIACFFETPWSELSQELVDDFRDSKGFLLNEAAICLRALGRLNEAIEPLRSSIDVAGKRNDRLQGGRRASNLCELRVILGELLKAVADAEQSLVLVDKISTNNSLTHVVARANFGDALHQCGRTAESSTWFGEAEALQSKQTSESPLLNSSRGFKYCDVLLHEAEIGAWQVFLGDGARWFHFLTLMERREKSNGAAKVERRVLQLLDWDRKSKSASLIDFALDYMTLGRAALYRAILDHSALASVGRHLTTAVDTLRRVGAQHHIPRGLLSRAWLLVFEDNAAGARADLDEAWDIAERGPMRLHLADIHLYRARLFFREKPYPWKSPQDDLAAAEKLINHCGYHRRDEELADAKAAIMNTK